MSEWDIVDKRLPGLVNHPTTQGIALTLQLLQKEDFTAILDVGCGSGIIAIAAASCWPRATILASDIHGLAVSHTKENVERNGLSERIIVLRAEGLNDDQIRQHAPYSLIVVNLLAELHLQYMRDYDACLPPGGYLILSGMLAWKSTAVLQAFSGLGYQAIQTIATDSWQTILLRKPGF